MSFENYFLFSSSGVDVVRFGIVVMHFISVIVFIKKKLEKEYYIEKNFKAIESKIESFEWKKTSKKCKKTIWVNLVKINIKRINKSKIICRKQTNF